MSRTDISLTGSIPDGAAAGTPAARPEPNDFRGLHYPLGTWVPEPARPHEVAPGVFWLRVPLPMSLNHINLWLLADTDGWTVVDTGLNMVECREAWDQVFAGFLKGARLKRMIVTHYHPDHFGLAGWLQERTGASLWMARTEYLMACMLTFSAAETPPEEALAFHRRAGWSEAWIDGLKAQGWGNFARRVSTPPLGFRQLSHGMTVEIGGRRWRIVTGTGHAPEHSCLICDSDRLMIAGDQVLPRITSNVSVYATEPEADPLADWMDSLAMLRTLDPDLFVLPAHNNPFIGLHTRVDQLVRDHRDKLDRLTALCQVAPRTAVDCFETLFSRPIEDGDIFPATGEALAHLHYLLNKGVLTMREDNGVRRFHAG